MLGPEYKVSKIDSSSYQVGNDAEGEFAIINSYEDQMYTADVRANLIAAALSAVDDMDTRHVNLSGDYGFELSQIDDSSYQVIDSKSNTEVAIVNSYDGEVFSAQKRAEAIISALRDFYVNPKFKDILSGESGDAYFAIYEKSENDSGDEVFKLMLIGSERSSEIRQALENCMMSSEHVVLHGESPNFNKVITKVFAEKSARDALGFKVGL